MVTMAVPLLFPALGELIAERAGIINIGLEGLVLAGAFTALVGAMFAGSTVLGVGAALAAGAALGAGLAFFVVRRNANQVVAGTALNLLVLGVTGVAYRADLRRHRCRADHPGQRCRAMPVLSALPIIGPAFFRQPLLAYAGFVLVPCLASLLAHTVPGLEAAHGRRKSACRRGAGSWRRRHAHRSRWCSAAFSPPPVAPIWRWLTRRRSWRACRRAAASSPWRS